MLKRHFNLPKRGKTGLNGIQRYYWITNLKGVRRSAVTMLTSCLQFFSRLYQSRFLWLTVNSLLAYIFFFFFFFHKKLTRKMGIEEQDYEECSIFCSFFIIIFRFNRDLIVWFLWRFAGLQSVPYWRSYHGYQQKKSCCIKHQVGVIGEAGMLTVTDCLLWV